MAESLLFPKLTTDQIDELRALGKEESTQQGQALFKEGEKQFDFFVVLSGSVDILDPSGNEQLVTTHEAFEFTGDTDMLSQRAAVVRAVVRQPGRVLRIPGEMVREIVAGSSSVSEVILNAFLARRAELINSSGHGVKVIGSRYSSDTYRIREFLSRNHIPYTWLDLENDPDAELLLDRMRIRTNETPIVIHRNETVYKNPTTEQLAKCMGVSAEWSSEVFDVCVVGAGPAGLAASVYAGSEGLNVITIDMTGPGGQAGTSSRIENYLGFPTGISGSDLASRAYTQAQKFGVVISIPTEVAALKCNDGHFRLELKNGNEIIARSIVIASGARYRKLSIPGLEQFEGNGIYYGATSMEAQTCLDQEIIVVGGGNSAGQAAVFLSQHARHVHMLIRGDTLASSMSRYLIDRIEDSDHITLHTKTQITDVQGNGHVSTIVCSKDDGETFSVETNHAFIMIGADPCTAWLCDQIKLDSRGFVKTGTDLRDGDLRSSGWSVVRKPFLLETSVPGIFAAGDVRSNSTKRVASAVGEGSMAVSFIHQFLGG